MEIYMWKKRFIITINEYAEYIKNANLHKSDNIY